MTLINESQSIYNSNNSINRSYSTGAQKENKKVAIILTKSVPGIGQIGQEMSVAKGYARNYFFMKGLAVFATHESRKQFEQFARNINYEELQVDKVLQKTVKKIKKVQSILLMRTANDEGSPTVNINESNIAYSLKRRNGLTIDPKDIRLTSPIEGFGNYQAFVTVGKNQVPLTVRFQSMTK
ncbi:hypothetical protein DFA_02598 [Cavenderia fasciculata]|uniref:50S ribosomal protein L9, chloroplastic n=1 Tax=Cavenderia fasciculata TaxID=261658 RepID=F4PZU5_CACFS|nr:uncharacterized protein DFA_02598 [Cavenderia fasciculata]EGG18859.1 hypothetical protein DFA_02598 [Cavenderia fasciculata]|eukprot:XP_004357321.1 hypothetical protein DFA_02598 [Cavenderia fasciculata]